MDMYNVIVIGAGSGGLTVAATVTDVRIHRLFRDLVAVTGRRGTTT